MRSIVYKLLYIDDATSPLHQGLESKLQTNIVTDEREDLISSLSLPLHACRKVS